ncbi:MAG: adaptor protein MecA [Agathobacter sp.]|nr:adaptor protein MecA [Agathobacter sp.]
MEFSREGNHIIRCVITEEEIEELGYTIDDIISNGVRTQEFMNRIFDMAEQELDAKFDMGVKSVRADIMPDHTISLTFSEHPGAEGMMGHIKDIVNGLLNTIPKQKWDEIKAIKDNDKTSSENEAEMQKPPKIIVLFAFEDLDILMRYAKQVRMYPMPLNQLYKLDGIYFLMMDMTDCEEEEVKRLSALTDEYATDIFVGSEKRAFIYEHGTAILKERAIEQLREI